MDYVIIVNDNGELKTISATEFYKAFPLHEHQMDAMLNHILDKRNLEHAEKRLDTKRRELDIANETIDAKTRS